jgi:hypothetical protein
MIFLKPSIEGLYIPVGAQCYLMDQVNELCLCYFGLSFNLIYFHFCSFSSMRSQVHIHLYCQGKVKETVVMMLVPRLGILVEEEGL